MYVGKCKECGIEKEYKYKSHVRQFCSHKCSNTSKARKKSEGAAIEVFVCKHCKKEFSMLASIAKVRKEKVGFPTYCSRKCSGLAARRQDRFVLCKCASCGESFTKRADQLKENNYCSKECRAKSQRKAGPWSETDRDINALREYNRCYRENNRERLNSVAREWAKNNRAYRNYIQQLRRAAGTISYSEWKSIIDKHRECAHCGSTDNLQVDHIIPVARGGKTEKSNLQVLCKLCNCSKGKSEKPKRSGDSIKEV